MALLVQNMERLDEQVKEEADGIYNTLGKGRDTNPSHSVASVMFILKQTAILRCGKGVMGCILCIFSYWTYIDISSFVSPTELQSPAQCMQNESESNS